MIVELLKEPTAEPLHNGTEHRRSRRHRVLLPATLLPVDAAVGADRFAVEVRDISLHGAGLRSAAPLVVGDVYLLDIGAGMLKLHARVRVANVRTNRDGTWDVGTAFC